MRLRARLALAAAIPLAISATRAHACSMAAGYKVPTNLELATRAEVIVVATITSERRAADVWDGVVVTTPTELIKGSALPPTVELPSAYLAMDSGERRFVTASAPRELRQPNPGALTGGCVRYVFAPGMRLVLFLARGRDGQLTPIRIAFSRDAEDVTGPGALWVKAVREYAAIGTGSRSEVAARLKARAAVLRAAGDADSVAIAADMDIERRGKRLAPYD